MTKLIRKTIVQALGCTLLAAAPAQAGACGTVNLALGKPVTALTNAVIGGPASVNDGRWDTVWYSYQGGNSNTFGFEIDLGGVYPIGRIDMTPAQTFGYTLSTSTDGTNWTERSRRNWPASVSYGVSLAVEGAYSARYFRYEAYANWIQFVGMAEFQVFGWDAAGSPPPPSKYGTLNLMLGKTASAASGSGFAAGNPPQSVADGNEETAWVPTDGFYTWEDNHSRRYGTAIADLGREYAIGKVVIKPAGMHACYLYFSSTPTLEAATPYVFVSFPDRFGLEPGTETKTLFLNGATTGRYVWIVPYITSPGTSPVYPSLKEVEIYEWEPQAPQADLTPPVIAPAAGGPQGANGWFTGPVALTWDVADPESGIVSANGCEPVTLTASGTVTCAATNGAGLSNSATARIEIDATRPEIAGMPGANCSLWPPNNKLVTVGIISASAGASGLSSFGVSASSNEPAEPGPDIVITGSGLEPRTVQLRAQRRGSGAGRVYTIVATAVNGASVSQTSTTSCAVPHDQGK